MSTTDEITEASEKNKKARGATQKSTRSVLHLAICSDLRMSILTYLNEGRKSLSELREELNVSSTTAIHALRELERYHLTFQDDTRNYQLTNIGSIMTQKTIDFSNTAEALTRADRFWLEHDVSGIPRHLLQKLGCLKDATVLTTDPTDIFKVHNTFVHLLQTAKEIKGISPIFVPDYPAIFAEIVSHQLEVQLIITEDVLSKILQTTDKRSLSTAIDQNLKLYLLKQNPKVAFTASDRFISLGLYTLDGTYDVTKDLMGQSEEALKWGNALFEHYVELSTRVTV